MRHSSSKPSAGTATKNGAPRERGYLGPELPVTIGSQLLGYLVVVIRSPHFEALTPERASLGMFSDAMPAIHAIFEQLFPESKST
jgi:hypothetical protein